MPWDAHKDVSLSHSTSRKVIIRAIRSIVVFLTEIAQKATEQMYPLSFVRNHHGLSTPLCVFVYTYR